MENILSQLDASPRHEIGEEDFNDFRSFKSEQNQS